MSERSTLAWLMWCYQEGYVTTADREVMSNWLDAPLVDMHPDDVILRGHLLTMADEVLGALSKIQGDRHALYIGCVLGLAMKHGIPLRPVVDAAGNYTDELVLTIPEDDITIGFVVPPPPADWSINDWIGGT